MRLILIFFITISTFASANSGDRFLVINPNGHRGTIKAMCVDSKGKIITAGYDKTIKIWNSKEGYLEREILGQIGPGDEGVIHAIAISPDDKYLAVAGWFGNTDGSEAVGDIRIFNYKTGALVKLLKYHVSAAFDMQFMGGSEFLLSAGQTGEVYMWQVDADKVWHADQIPADITDIEMFGDHYYTSHNSGLIYKWESNFQKPLGVFKKLQKEGLPASELAVSPNGERIAVSSGGDVFLLDANLKQLYSFNHSEDQVSMLDFSPNSSRLLVASSSVYLKENHVRVYEEADKQWYRLSAYMKHTDAVGCARFIDNSTCVTAGGAENEVVIWKVEETKKYSTVLHFLCGVGKPVHSAGMNGDKIGFATTWSKNDGLTPFQFTFDLAERLVRTYNASDSCLYPQQTSGDYKVVRPSSLKTLTIKKGDITKASITRDFTNGIFHLAYTFIDQRYLVSGGAYGYIEVYDLAGQKVSTLVGHDGDIRALAVSGDGRYLVSGGSDQTIRIWLIDDFASKTQVLPVASLFAATNGEWVLWNEDGYFMSSKKGASYVGYHINQGRDKEAKYYPFEQFDIQYNRPDIIMEDLGVVDQGIIDLYHSAYLKRLKRMNIAEADLAGVGNIPVVKLTSTPVGKEKVSIQVTASDEHQQLKTINVFLNDVPVYGRNGLAVTAGQKTISQKIDLDLMAGVNKIQVSVTNMAGVESLKETVTLTNTVETQSNLYVVSLGVSHYLDSAYNLEYAAKDAKDVDALFGQSDHFKNVYHKLLTDSEVTKENISGLKTFLSEAQRNDVVIFFIAGHGVLNKTLDYYYCTYNMDFKTPEKNGVAYAEMEAVFDGIKAIRKLLIMDTCHSGEVDKDDVEEIAFVNTENDDISFRTTNTTTALRETQGLAKTNEAVKEMFNDLRRGTGATVISSAGGAEYAMESDEWKNGLFTFCLLEGLKTKNADKDNNGEIMLSELQSYISEKVEELSKGRQMPTSRFENLALDYRIW